MRVPYNIENGKKGGQDIIYSYGLRKNGGVLTIYMRYLSIIVKKDGERIIDTDRQQYSDLKKVVFESAIIDDEDDDDNDNDQTDFMHFFEFKI